MKLTRKFIVALLPGTAIVLVLSTFINYQREAALFDRDMQAQGAALGRALARGVSQVWARDGERAALDHLVEAFAPRDHLHVRWVWLEPTAPPAQTPAVPLYRLATLMVAGNITIVGRGPDGPALYTYVAARVPGRRSGAIEVRETMTAKRAYLSNSLLIQAVQGSALFVIIAALTVLLGMVFVGRPVSRLVAKARRVGDGDLSTPLLLRQRDELGELAAEINLMCERLADEQAARTAATAQLRHADRLSTVGVLASGLAHELGTPLNVVTGRARLIADAEVDGDDARASARVVVEQSERMTGLIRQLLGFARPRATTKEPIDLVGLGASVCDMLDAMARAAQVELVPPPDDSDAPDIAVDRGQIQQVIINLVVNGIQATPPGGKVSIEIGSAVATAPADLGGERATWTTLTVRDTGAGMDETTRSRVFEPFFTTKAVGDGTGLGLSVTWSIVREHGGWIAVESTPGQGSAFVVHLPGGHVPGGHG